MNCETFLRILADFQQNALAPERRREADAHLEVCGACRGLVRPDAPTPPDLAKGILARTTGSPCGRLREQAAALVDGALDEMHRALVEGHLEHCPECAALVSALRKLTTVLPTLAEADPGPLFLRDVLVATSRNPLLQPVAQPFSWQDLGERVMHLLRRPRIAFEAAYVGALAGFLFVSLPHPQGHFGEAPLKERTPLVLPSPLVRAAGFGKAVAGSGWKGLREIGQCAGRGGEALSDQVSLQLQRLEDLRQHWTRAATERYRESQGRPVEETSKDSSEPSREPARSSP